MKHLHAALVLTLAATSFGACAHSSGRIPGTKISDDQTNRQILEAVEKYRVAVERRDAEALVLMASPAYWEDRGTAEASDDFGVDKLREVLAGRFQLASDIRYSMRYDRIRTVCPGGGVDHLEKGCRAHVEVQIDASFSINDARGQQIRKDKRDQNELVLEYDGSKWLFVSGM